MAENEQAQNASGVKRAMRDGHAFIDTFSALDHLSNKDKANPIKLLEALTPRGRFSVFEATETQPIARSFSALVSNGWMRLADPNEMYPWTVYETTEKGFAVLGIPAPTGGPSNG